MLPAPAPDGVIVRRGCYVIWKAGTAGGFVFPLVAIPVFQMISVGVNIVPRSLIIKSISLHICKNCYVHIMIYICLLASATSTTLTRLSGADPSEVSGMAE